MGGVEHDVDEPRWMVEPRVIRRLCIPLDAERRWKPVPRRHCEERVELDRAARIAIRSPRHNPRTPTPQDLDVLARLQSAGRSRDEARRNHGQPRRARTRRVVAAALTTTSDHDQEQGNLDRNPYRVSQSAHGEVALFTLRVLPKGASASRLRLHVNGVNPVLFKESPPDTRRMAASANAATPKSEENPPGAGLLGLDVRRGYRARRQR